MQEKQTARLENEIKHLKEKRRQFLLDYHFYQLSNNGFIENQNEENSLVGKIEIADESKRRPTDELLSAKSSSLKEELAKTKRNSSRKSTGKSPVNNNCSNLSPVVLPGAPFIVYSLQDYDILEDWSIIKMHSS